MCSYLASMGVRVGHTLCVIMSKVHLTIRSIFLMQSCELNADASIL